MPGCTNPTGYLYSISNAPPLGSLPVTPTETIFFAPLICTCAHLHPYHQYLTDSQNSEGRALVRFLTGYQLHLQTSAGLTPGWNSWEIMEVWAWFSGSPASPIIPPHLVFSCPAAHHPLLPTDPGYLVPWKAALGLASVSAQSHLALALALSLGPGNARLVGQWLVAKSKSNSFWPDLEEGVCRRVIQPWLLVPYLSFQPSLKTDLFQVIIVRVCDLDDTPMEEMGFPQI